MLTKEYFDIHLPMQIQQMGAGHTTVMVHLYNGRTFKVSQFVEATDHCVLLQVYPGEDEDPVLSRVKPGKPASEVTDDQVALPYASICYVELTITKAKPEEQKTIGFGGKPRTV